MLFLGVTQFTISNTSASNSLNILPPGGEPYGLSYPKHIENFWKWMLSIPADENHPYDDTTGEKCSVGQNDSSVFYLANTDGTKVRTCDVPAGKALLIPVMVVEVSRLESPNSDDAGLTLAAKEDQDSLGFMYLKIDNTEYKQENLANYRTHTDPFEVYFASPGLFGIQGGENTTAVADGWYILTEPLSKGNHTIYFSARLGEAEHPIYAQTVTYHIISQ
jgi:hypothetical protein